MQNGMQIEASDANFFGSVFFFFLHQILDTSDLGVRHFGRCRDGFLSAGKIQYIHWRAPLSCILHVGLFGCRSATSLFVSCHIPHSQLSCMQSLLPPCIAPTNGIY